MRSFIRYKVEFAIYHGLVEVLEMLRYSSSIVVEIEKSDLFIITLIHPFNYDNPTHKNECIRFFENKILKRWESFGFTIIGEWKEE